MNGAIDAAGLQELLGDAAGDRRRHGEADALTLADDHRVDADHLAVEVDERAARVARVDAGVGLEVVLDRVDADAAAALGAEHAGRHAVAEAEGRADREDPLADARRVAVAEVCLLEVLRVDANHGEIGRRVAADDPRRKHPAVTEADGDRPRVFDDMVVGEDRAVVREDHPRAEAALDRLGLGPTKARGALAGGDVDLDDARADPLGDVGEGFAEAASVARAAARRGGGLRARCGRGLRPGLGMREAGDARKRRRRRGGRGRARESRRRERSAHPAIMSLRARMRSKCEARPRRLSSRPSASAARDRSRRRRRRGRRSARRLRLRRSRSTCSR